ncbi:hypothetical protein ABW19_dt0200344 [Dactylella cylindrospora]|nr:hypothetical protein ABW19_dt0200344 [Dactylella cylindrospora]
MDFDPVLFTPIIDRILRSSELAAVSAKDVRKSLQQELGYDISEHKSDVTALIKERFDMILEEAEGEPVSPVKQEPPPAANGRDVKRETVSTPSRKRKSVASPSVDQDARLAAKLQAEWNSQDRPSRAAAPKRKSTTISKKKKSAAATSDDESEKKKRKINPNNPFHKPLNLSPQLSAFLGETRLSRPETVKRIWAYIKDNGLQDEKDKRYITCDDNLRTVFPSSKVHMFTMNKILSDHLYPLTKEQEAEWKSEISSQAGIESQGSPVSSVGPLSPISSEAS